MSTAGRVCGRVSVVLAVAAVAARVAADTHGSMDAILGGQQGAVVVPADDKHWEF
jgi:hypothetical protein